MKTRILIIGLLVLSFNMGCSKSDNTPVDSGQAICYAVASIKKYGNTDNTKLKETSTVTPFTSIVFNVIFELEKTSCKNAAFKYSYDKQNSVGGVVINVSGAKSISDLTLVGGNNYVGKLSDGKNVNLKLPTSVPSTSDQISIEYKEGDITYTFSGY